MIVNSALWCLQIIDSDQQGCELPPSHLFHFIEALIGKANWATSWIQAEMSKSVMHKTVVILHVYSKRGTIADSSRSVASTNTSFGCMHFIHFQNEYRCLFDFIWRSRSCFRWIRLLQSHGIDQWPFHSSVISCFSFEGCWYTLSFPAALLCDLTNLGMGLTTFRNQQNIIKSSESTVEVSNDSIG